MGWAGRPYVRRMPKDQFTGGLPRLIEAEYVSGDFFRVLGVAPILGRAFTLDDERDESRPIILSYPFWAAEFHSSPDIVGKHIRISDRLATVIGVMPPGFGFPGVREPPSYWATFFRGSFAGVGPSGIPQKETVSPASQRNDRTTQVIARLRQGVSIAQARSELNAIQRSLAEQYPEDRNAYGVEVQPLLEYVSNSGGYRKSLYLLFGAVTAVLLISCANVAGLLLARGFARRHEFSVRVALCAKPAHIVRQVLIESVVLALCGGAIGIGVAFVLLKTVLILAPADLPRLAQVRIDWIVMAFALVVSLVTGIGFGVFPALAASRSDSSGLWRAGRGISTGRGEHRMGMSAVEYPEDKAPLFFRQLFPRLAAIPGVESVSSSYPIPFTYDTTGRFSIAGRPTDPNDLAVANRVACSMGLGPLNRSWSQRLLLYFFWW